MLHTAIMNERFKIKGINDEESFCMCCGKSGLQKVVWIEDTETGEIQHFGCICALKPTKAFGLTKADLKFSLSMFEDRISQAHRMARKTYREAGGKMMSLTPYSSGPADKAAYAQYLSEAKLRIKEIYAA